MTKNEAEFVKILDDVSRLPEDQAKEAFTFISDLLICTLYGGKDFLNKAQKLCDEGKIEEFKKLVESESRALKLGSFLYSVFFTFFPLSFL